MNTEKFTQIYNESRNGANGFIRHPLARNFAFSDGVRDLADTGCWWMLDIFATELPAVFRKNEDVSNQCIVTAVVTPNQRASLYAEFEDGVVAWKRGGIQTDLPVGRWKFLVADEGEGPTPYRMILISEY